MEGRLSIKRPTPTTVLYTVSTRSPTTTLAGHLASYLSIVVRLLIGFLVTTVLLLEYRRTASLAPYITSLASLEAFILNSPFGQLAIVVVSQVDRIYAVPICGAVTWLILRKGYTEESLLVIRGLGVQTSTSSPSYLWTSSTRFIPTSNIQDIFIHEAFKGFEVRFYLSIVVEGEEDVVVVFPNILPRREILEDVWRGTRACLYEPKT